MVAASTSASMPIPLQISPSPVSVFMMEGTFDDDESTGTSVGNYSYSPDCVLQHMEVVKKQYDTKEKLDFYAEVMGDGTNNIHFGKWDNIDASQPGAYGRASEQMTDFMFELAMNLLPHRKQDSAKAKAAQDASRDFKYVDLGGGTGAAAIRITEQHDYVGEATSLNISSAQNFVARKLCRDSRLEDRVKVATGSYEDAPFPANRFDLAFSQDAFVHAYSKIKAYAEAFRITKPGGAFVFCDLMCGHGHDVTKEELESFAAANMINDWKSPDQNITSCQEAGWEDVTFVDLTKDIRVSFQLMLRKVAKIIDEDDLQTHLIDPILLANYMENLRRRIQQVDRGVFKWGIIHARKPVRLALLSRPPMPLTATNHLIKVSEVNAQPTAKTSVAVIDILYKMTKEKIEALPPSVELLVTMSAGLDHIDMAACAKRGITVRQAGRDAITSSVVQYTLGFIILGLRNAMSQISVAFPSKGWDLNWNCEGTPLSAATVGIVGMGVIAKDVVSEIRKLSSETKIMYHVPPTFREKKFEKEANLIYVESLKQMARSVDALVPLCPLNKFTENLVSREVLQELRPHAGLINVARGKIVDHEALTEVLEAHQIKYALLDTTFPEPLPAEHPLWKLRNCFIFPHYATNTTAVRQALVDDIQPIVAEFYGLGDLDEMLEKAEEEKLRYDLAVAHRLTAEYKMDMLVWNHISARFQSGCIITPGRKMWSRIKPDDLVFASSNVTADIIHDAIYKAREDIGAVIHLHTPNAVAVSCLEGGFQAFTQDAAYFYGKVATYDWDGVSDEASEGPAITEAVQSVEGSNTLLMHNHGYACYGRTVKEAWVLAYYFERCCEVQLNVMRSGGKIRMPSKAVMAKAAEASYLPEFAPGQCEWDALCEEISFK